MDVSEAEIWHPARPTPNLQPGQAHVWRARLVDTAGAGLQVLSAEEGARAERFIFAQHRARFVCAHIFLRGILAFYTGVAAADIQFRTTPAGKPYLADAAATLRFNLSHSDDLMAVAICQGSELGVDIEVHSEQLRWRDIATSYFNPREIAAIESGPVESARLEKFYRAWTLKEAFLKAQGGGLTELLEQVEVDLSDRARAGFLRLPQGEQEKHHWQVYCFKPGRGASGAIVMESRDGLRPELIRFSVEDQAELSV